jgi:hypothetical protein
MASTSKPRTVQCVYCLQYTDDGTVDHVFPAAWYPECTPVEVERWTVPACRTCNEKYGRNEQELLVRLGLCIDPDDIRASGVAAKALRSLDPGSGRSDRDRRARLGKRRDVLSGMESMPAPPRNGVFPGFGPIPTRHYDDYAVIKVHRSALEMLGEKIARGLTYWLDRRTVPAGTEIHVYFLEERVGKEILAVLKRFSETHHRGPGISVTRAVAEDDNRAAVFAIEIWGRLRLYVTLGLGGASPADP